MVTLSGILRINCGNLQKDKFHQDCLTFLREKSFAIIFHQFENISHIGDLSSLKYVYIHFKCA